MQPVRFLNHIEGSPTIKYKSHDFTKYRVRGKQRERERERERDGDMLTIRMHGEEEEEMDRAIRRPCRVWK
jgi:hypothetical protein